jgi:short-subunit dehydrogenase
MKSFQGKVAAITGAGSGIGRALALTLAQDHCDLALSDINEAAVAETAERATKYGARVTYRRVDVADRTAVHAWADASAAEHGKVNLIFNNAGVALGSTLEGVAYEDFEWIMNINFWGVVYGTKAFLPHLRASGEGHVVNISSVFGLVSVPSQGAYNASKFAVRGFTEALRQELDMGDGTVSATCVHPGGIRTNIAKHGRIASNLDGFVDGGAEASRANLEKLFITSARDAAKAILRAVKHNKRRVLVGPDAYAIDMASRLMGSRSQLLTTAFARMLARG